MLKIYMILTIFFLSLNLVAQQKDSIWLKKRLTFMLDSCKTTNCKGDELYNFLEKHEKISFNRIAFLAIYDTVSSTSVRNNLFSAYGYIYDHEPQSQQEALYKRMFFKMNEHKVSISYGLGAEKNVKKEYFSQKTQDSIRHWINTKKTDEIDNENWLFLYAGFLEMKDLIPKIKEHASGWHSSLENYWVMQIALARMGDKEALDYCLKVMKEVRRETPMLFNYKEDMQYIKQGVIFDWLTDLTLADTKYPFYNGIREMIAETITNYPFKDEYIYFNYDGTLKDKETITKVKNWLKSQKGNWQFDRSKMY